MPIGPWVLLLLPDGLRRPRRDSVRRREESLGSEGGTAEHAGPVTSRSRLQRSRRLANPNSPAISAPAAAAVSATSDDGH